MEILKQAHILLPSAITFTVAFIIYSTLRRFFTQYNKKDHLAPEAKGGWPILGHLPLLHPLKLPHKVLASMADKFGPIFRINLGVHEILIISTSEMAKECLLTNDKATAGRPKSVAIDIFSYNYAIFGFGPYGSYWRTMRKIVMLELLSNQRLSTLSHVWKSHIQILIENIFKTWSESKNVSSVILVDMTELFGDFTKNIVLQIVTGKQLERDSEMARRIRKPLREFFLYIGSFTVGDALPYLRWLDLGGKEKTMKRVFRELDDILEGWLQEHKEKRRRDGRNREDVDFMDVLLSVLDHNATKDCNFDADTINKATCLSMIAGGTDTTTVTLTWALSLLLNNPHVLNKAKRELDEVVGKERRVSDSDIPKLEYLQAIVKETFRLYPPGPLMGPREFIDDCKVGGYRVKQGTRLMVNLYKIFRDPSIWKNPLEFQPDRFLTSYDNLDVKGQHFELFPFGAGRRICPGISFGLQVVHLTLASVLHAFDFLVPDNSIIDMGETFGLTNMKTQPLKVLITPSSSCGSYAT